ncbi:MAG TPA: hypothetical protein ENH84_07270 [Phycisphaerae bacterium]|nr:hypothetical protein [Phycisphaerae bacterium]
MKTAYLTGIRKVEIRQTDPPEIAADTDVLLEVETVGVCGSDMHYYRTGRIAELVVEYPFIVGHEFTGRVLEVGRAVTNLKVGDRVAVDPLIWCGKCDQCLTGREHTCRNQKFLGCPGQIDGCLCERIVMPARSCFILPGDVTADQAVLIEPFSIGLYAQRFAGDMKGKRVGILGAGPIGLCVLAASRAAGARTIYVTDIRNVRVDFARRFGADWAGNPEKEDVVAAITAAEPDGLDVVFECAGKQETVDQAVHLLTPGGTLLLIGIPEEDRISVHISSVRRRELTIQNVRRQNRCVPDALEMVATGKVSLDAMITHRFTLTQTQEAFDIVADYRDGCIKAMIDL